MSNSKSTHAQIWILHNIVFLSTHKNNSNFTFLIVFSQSVEVGAIKTL
jgi:hypothetical protein